ncbi:MAG TPA: Ger(x)C family spore germination protein [Oscillospiraceae bacterium]|nr:Ger(x)C family spore germination protein [Oscillospiraceae bacterium]
MAKKFVCLLVSLFFILTLTGCWSYHGLNEITIIAGVGIDIDPSNSDYIVTCEVIDTASSGKDSGIKAGIVESRGKTIFDAVRNAKKRLNNKLYWGNAQILIIGNQLAQQEKLGTVTDWFISDAECRENIGVIVSQEKSAKDLLTSKGLDNPVVSYEIKKIVDDDQSTTGSIESVPLFHVYNDLRDPGISVALPAFHIVKNEDKPVVEANGESIFKGEKLLGYLSAAESKNYLFAIGAIKGGILTVSSSNSAPQDVTLEIAKNKTKTSYSCNGEKVKVMIQTDTDVYLDEDKPNVDFLDQHEIEQLETKAQNMLEHNITNTVKRVQTDYNSDIFSFGNMIYKKDPKLWEQLEPKWDKLFPSIQVEVKSKVNIVNTSFLKHS